MVSWSWISGRVAPSEASLIHTFSTVKPLSACSLLLLVERGEVTLSTALGTIWPELSGAAHGEHAPTYGHLIGELVRRISGRSIGSFIRSEISEERLGRS